MVPPGGPVFGPFILSDVLKLCKLLCAQNVKLKATLTQTASVAGILNCNAGIDLASGVSALLAWFPASWASKVAPCFIGDAGGATQLPQEVTIQCPTWEAANTQRDDGDQVFQAVKFTDKKVPGPHLDLDEDLQAAGCFTEAIRGYQMGVVTTRCHARPSASRSNQSHAS